jgi:hypothetical protein
MRKAIAVAAAAILIPAAALAEEKDKPDVADSLGAAVGGAVGYAAGAAAGPLGGAVGGLAGQSLGKGLVGGVKKLLGSDEKEQAHAEPVGPGPATLADLSPQREGSAPVSLEELEARGGPPPSPAAPPAVDPAPTPDEPAAGVIE